MKTWPVQDAKAKFSEMLNACLKEGPQVVTRRGAETAILVPIEEWRQLATKPDLTIKEWLSMEPRIELELPPRGRLRLRPPPKLV